MNIVHIALCGPVTDGMTYQENLLSKYHKKMGNDVTVICSFLMWGKDGKKCFSDTADMINSDGVRFIRIKEKRNNPQSVIRIFPDLYSKLTELNPDVLFIHGCQFLDINTLAKYLKKHPDCIAYCDSHADFGNSATTHLSKDVLHKIIWRYHAKKINKFVKIFYGVTPSRVDFLHEMYALPKNRIKLLTMGADDEAIAVAKENNSREKLRKQYNIPAEAFVVCAGGKIDSTRSAYLDIINAVNELKDKNIYLIIFGSISEDVLEKYNNLFLSCSNIIYAGWCDKARLYELHQAADLFVYPCLHSVMWEETAGNGVPAIYHNINGVSHLDNNGNCIFIDKTDKDTIKNAIIYCIDNYDTMKKISAESSSKYLYSEIAKSSIYEC